MSDNRIGGLLGGFLAGVGLASVILLPFAIGYRYGIHILASLFALVATL